MIHRLLLAISTSGAILAAGSALSQESVAQEPAPGERPMVIAHRSAILGDAPENSLAWIAAAIDRGVDMVHINPQLSEDGRYVLMHDNTLNRTTDVERVFPDGPPGGPTRDERGGKDYVRDYTLADIARLRIVAGDGSEVHQVPTLQEALDMIDGKVTALLGLKSYEVESLSAELAGRNRESLFLFELCYPGTDQSKLRAAAETTGLGVVAVLYQSRDYATDLEWLVGEVGPGLRMVSVGSRNLTPDFLSKMDGFGLRAIVSGWNGPEDSALAERGDPGPWKAVLDQGMVASTDLPELLLDALGR